jgi:hypothetical protein
MPFITLLDPNGDIFSGRTVKSSFICAWSPSRPSGVTKIFEKMSSLFWMFLTKRNTFYFFIKIIFYYQLGPGVSLWGPVSGSTAHIFCMGMMNYSVSIMGLSQAEQNCILCVHIFSCLYCTVQVPGASLASVLSTNHRRASSNLFCSVLVDAN